MISRNSLAFGKLCLPICTLLFQYWPRMVVLELNLSPYLSSCYHLTANGLGRMVFLGLKFDSQCVSLLASLLVCFPGKMIFWESIFFFQCVRIFFLPMCVLSASPLFLALRQMVFSGSHICLPIPYLCPYYCWAGGMVRFSPVSGLCRRNLLLVLKAGLRAHLTIFLL